MSPALTRKTNTERRNNRIRQQFKQRYTEQSKPRRYTKEFIVDQLAQEFCLSTATIERIITTK